MRSYAPDKDDPFPQLVKGGGGGNNNANNGGGNGGGPKMPAFQPGQLSAIASQLAGGFGGGLNAWKRDMRRTYDPTPMKDFNFGANHHGNGGGNRNGGGGNRNGGGDGTKPGGGSFDPSSPRNRMMPMNAKMPAMMPQMGLFSAGPMNAQQPQQQQQGLLGDVPPEVLAFIRSRGV